MRRRCESAASFDSPATSCSAIVAFAASRPRPVIERLDPTFDRLVDNLDLRSESRGSDSDPLSRLDEKLGHEIQAHDFEAADVVWKTVKNGEQRLHLRAAAHADVEHTRLLSLANGLK